jgi:hypothetical protein
MSSRDRETQLPRVDSTQSESENAMFNHVNSRSMKKSISVLAFLVPSLSAHAQISPYKYLTAIYTQSANTVFFPNPKTLAVADGKKKNIFFYDFPSGQKHWNVSWTQRVKMYA